MAESPVIIPVGGTVYLDPFTQIVGFSFGASGWNFYGIQIDISLFTIQALLFNTVGANQNTDGTGLLTAVSCFGKSWGLSKNDGEWNVIAPNAALSQLHAGAFDAEDFTVDRKITANSSEPCVAVEVNGGTERHIISPSQTLQVSFGGAANHLLATEADPEPGIGQSYTPAAANFYYAEMNVPAPVYGMNEQAEVRSIPNDNDLATPPIATLHDVFISDPSTDLTEMNIYSIRLGIVHTQSGLPGFFAFRSRAAATTKDSFFLFNNENFTAIPADPDGDYVADVGITKVTGSFGASGLEYAATKNNVTFNVGGGPALEFIGAVATRTQGYAFAASVLENGDDIGVRTLRLLDGSANVSVLDAAFRIHDADDSTEIERVFGATIDRPWMATFDRRVGTRKLRIYNDTGLVYESGEVMAGVDGLSQKLFLNGNTRDHIYFAVKGAAGEQFIVRGDGQTFDLQDFEAGAVLPFPTGTNNVLPSVTSREIIYNVFQKPSTLDLKHITNMQGDPPAPVLKDYVDGPAGASIPVRSNLLRLQEFEAWA